MHSTTSHRTGDAHYDTLRREIRAFLSEHAAVANPEPFGDQESLLDLGILDSMAMLDLIAHLEGSFAISIREDDMIPEHFDSVEAITRYVQSRQA